MADVFTVLAQDHQEVKAMLAELERGPTKATGATEGQLALRKKMTEQLIIEESRHEALEEMYFWPAVRDRLQSGDTLADEATGQEQDAKQVLASLDKLCEVNPLLLGISTAAAGVHEATAIWDVRAAVHGGREVRPAEQHIHSFLESLPFMATSALLCLHWDQVNDVWQGRAGSAAWRLRLRRKRLPAGYLGGVLAGVASLIAAPYAEELWRCARARKRAASAAVAER